LENAQVNGITIAYEMVGQGEPLLLIQGAVRAFFQKAKQ
jgi:hypothetical protein